MSPGLDDPTRRQFAIGPVLAIVFGLGVLFASCSSPSTASKVSTLSAAESSGASVAESAPTATVSGRQRVASESSVQPGELEVVVIGDSLTVAADQEIRAALDRLGVGSVEVDAVEGRRMVEDLAGKPSGRTAVGRVAATLDAADVDVWVIALGTNDVGAQAPTDELDRAIVGVLDTVGTSRPVAWIDVFIGAKPDESADFGARVRTAAIERGTMVVGDWYHPAQDDGMLVTDGVHLTGVGRDAFAETIADSVARLIPNQTAAATRSQR